MFTKKSTLLILSFFILIMFGCSKPESRILGVWKITFGLTDKSANALKANIKSKNSKFEKRIYKIFKEQSLPSIVTFHKKGQITSRGMLVGTYKFIDKDSLKFEREPERLRFVYFDEIYVTIVFLSKYKM